MITDHYRNAVVQLLDVMAVDQLLFTRGGRAWDEAPAGRSGSVRVHRVFFGGTRRAHTKPLPPKTPSAEVRPRRH